MAKIILLKKQNKALITILFISFIYFFTSSSIFAFATQDHYSLGIQSMHYRKVPQFWSLIDFGAIDASTKTSPPGSFYYNRRVETFTFIGGDLPLVDNRLSARLSLKNFSYYQKGEEAEEPKTPRTSEKVLSIPSLDFTFINHKGLEIIVGIESHYYTKEKVSISSSVADSNIDFKPTAVQALRAALVRRGGGWSGGFYYIQGRETSRNFTKISSDESLITGESFVSIPSQYGLVSEFSLGSAEIEMDLAMVQAGAGGERSTNGSTVLDDHLRVYFATKFSLSNIFSLSTSISHQTLSYSDHAYANVDTMPVSSLGAIFTLADFLKFGLIYGSGKDGVDTTEYKSRFTLEAVAFRLGISTSI